MAKYIEDGITYNNVIRPSFLTTGRLAKGSYEIDNEDNIIQTSGPFINAIDIDWNGVKVNFNGSNKIINTTTDLIKSIQDIRSAQGIKGAQGITGSQGVTGSRGIQGMTGIPGIIGAQGTTGAQGPNNNEFLEYKEQTNQIINNLSERVSLLETNLTQLSEALVRIADALNEKINSNDLATVAISGDYNDLINIPNN